MSAFETLMHALRNAGESVKIGNGKARTRGLCHDGDAPDTVSFEIGRNKNVVVWCHKCQDAPGALDTFLSKVGLTQADLFDEKGTGRPISAPVKTWAYTDADGLVVQYVDRYVPKQVLPRLPDGSVRHPPKDQRVLLYLPQVLAEAGKGGTVLVCEGEPDTDTARRLGRVATTMPGGSGMGWQDRYTEMLRGVGEVRIIADRDPDDVGMKHARKVANSLARAGIQHRIYLPACGKDLSDHVAAGAGLADLIEVRDEEQEPADDETESDEPAADQPGEDRFPAIDWHQAFATDFSQIDWLPGRFMERGQQVAVVGPGKAGKSLFAAHWLWCAITGRSFLGDDRRTPIRVLYLDRENSLRDIVTRMISLGANPAELAGGFDYRMFPRFSGALDASVIAAQELLHLVGASRPDVVVLDTVSRFIGGKENDADTWLQFYGRIHAPLKALGVACVRLDHMGKDEERGSRGSSAKTQDVDHVWELVKLADRKSYDPGSGVETIATDLRMNRTHTRSGLGEDTFSIVRVGRRQKGGMWVAGGTGHALAGDGWEPGAAADTPREGSVEWLVAELDKAGVDPRWGNPRVRQWCAENGLRVRKEKIEEAVRLRKTKGANWVPPHLPHDLEGRPSPDSGEHFDKTAGQTFPQPIGGTSGEPQARPSFPRPLPREGEGRAGKVLCADCGTPLAPFLISTGATVHITCEDPNNHHGEAA